MSPRLESDEVTIPARVVGGRHDGRPFDRLIVAKITFDLRPGTCPVAAVQEAMVLEGGTYGPLSNSLRRIQDIAPQKPRSEVLVVGSAFAPGGVHDKAFEVRVQASTVDTVILVRPPRFLEKDGTVTMEAGPHATQLSYELSRWDETWNPFGVDDASPGESGRIPLPRIELPAESDSVSGPVGLGPIPLFSDWSVRSLGKTPDGVVELLWD